MSLRKLSLAESNRKQMLPDLDSVADSAESSKRLKS